MSECEKCTFKPSSDVSVFKNNGRVFEIKSLADYKSVLSQPLIVLDFGTSWCGPCKRLKPKYEELALRFKGKILFAYIDAEKQEAIAVKYGIASYPSICTIKNGKLVNGPLATGLIKDVEKLVAELL